jgi:hypothetical protein
MSPELSARRSTKFKEMHEVCENPFEYAVLGTIIALFEWMDTLEEPGRKGCLAHLVLSKCFQTFIVCCIMLNTIFLAYTTDWEMQNLGNEPSLLIKRVELAFSVVYSVVFLLKLAVHRWYFFLGPDARWNIRDDPSCMLCA